MNGGALKLKGNHQGIGHAPMENPAQRLRSGSLSTQIEPLACFSPCVYPLAVAQSSGGRRKWLHPTFR